MKLVVRLVNNDVVGTSDTNSQVRIHCVHLATTNAAKFFVVDDAVDRTFRYEPVGARWATARCWAPTVPGSPRGVAANATGVGGGWWTRAGTCGCTTDRDTGRRVEQANEQPDRPAGDHDQRYGPVAGGCGCQRGVYRYVGGATWPGGTGVGEQFVRAARGQHPPSDLVTDGTKIWVTDEGTDEVFVYSLAGVFGPLGAGQP